MSVLKKSVSPGENMLVRKNICQTKRKLHNVSLKENMSGRKKVCQSERKYVGPKENISFLKHR